MTLRIAMAELAMMQTAQTLLSAAKAWLGGERDRDRVAANLRTKILDVGGLDSSIILIQGVELSCP